MMTAAWKLDQPSSSQEESKSNELVVNDYSQLEGNIGFMLKRLRQRLATRGAKAFIQLHKILRTIDANKDGRITQPELFNPFTGTREKSFFLLHLTGKEEIKCFFAMKA